MNTVHCIFANNLYMHLPMHTMQDLKLKYYRLMIELCQHDQKYLAICQHFRAIFDTPKVKQDEALWKDVSELKL